MIVRRRPTTLSSEELQQYLRQGQNDYVAFLTAKASARGIAETLSAMANANGGLLLLGVSKSGTPQKEVDTGALCNSIAEAGLVADPPLILPSPQVIALGDAAARAIVAVQVPPGLPHIYAMEGRYLTRTAGQNRALTTPELRRLMLERGDSGFESLTVPNATISDLDPRRIERYLTHISVAPDEEPLQALLARGCATYPDGPLADGTTSETLQAAQLAPTAAGILLFGRDPQRFLRSAEVICVRYPGADMSDEFVRQDIGGTLPEQVRQAEAFVTGNMRRGMKIAGVAREETNEYPLPVVREAIVNAIAHRDYSIRGEGVRLLMFSNRLEVYSPGRLPGHVTLDNLVDERYSRNEAVVAVLTDLGYIERLGYGIDRMIVTMRDAGLPDPIFEEMAAGFKVTLQSDSVNLVSAQPQEQPWAHTYLNERQEQALAYIGEHGRITNSEYQALSPDVSAETLRRDLVDLVEKNMLLRIGEKRATYYILK